jgi:hypothetical protein
MLVPNQNLEHILHKYGFPKHTFSVLCAQVTATLEATETLGQRMTGVRYSRLRPALLGTACESGRVSFWDWYIKKINI